MGTVTVWRPRHWDAQKVRRWDDRAPSERRLRLERQVQRRARIALVAPVPEAVAKVSQRQQRRIHPTGRKAGHASSRVAAVHSLRRHLVTERRFMHQDLNTHTHIHSQPRQRQRQRWTQQATTEAYDQRTSQFWPISNIRDVSAVSPRITTFRPRADGPVTCRGSSTLSVRAWGFTSHSHSTAQRRELKDASCTSDAWIVSPLESVTLAPLLSSRYSGPGASPRASSASASRRPGSACSSTTYLTLPHGMMSANDHTSSHTQDPYPKLVTVCLSSAAFTLTLPSSSTSQTYPWPSHLAWIVSRFRHCLQPHA